MRTFEYQNLLSLNECFASALFAVKNIVASLILFDFIQFWLHSLQIK